MLMHLDCAVQRSLSSCEVAPEHNTQLSLQVLAAHAQSAGGTAVQLPLSRRTPSPCLGRPRDPVRTVNIAAANPLLHNGIKCRERKVTRKECVRRLSGTYAIARYVLTH